MTYSDGIFISIRESPVGRISRRRNPILRLQLLSHVIYRFLFFSYEVQYRPNPPGGVGEMLDFFGFEGAVEDGAFAVGEPFFEDLVAAEFVGPDRGGDIAPEGAVVQVDIEGGFAERGYAIAHRCLFVPCVGTLDDAALARHDGIACSEVAPAGRHCEVVSGHVPTVRGSRHGNDGNFRA